ncbi:hypothetical protein [Streptomyces tendae]|uniref:hypothetical protein n=1 Tax=Streptomyces tendae TaxID=1932 RepID=UPI0036765E40
MGMIIAQAVTPKDNFAMGWLIFGITFLALIAYMAVSIQSGDEVGTLLGIGLGVSMRLLRRSAVRDVDEFRSLGMLIRYEVIAHWLVPWLFCAAVLQYIWNFNGNELPVAAKSGITATLTLACLAAGIKTAARTRKTYTSPIEKIDDLTHEIQTLETIMERRDQSEEKGLGEDLKDRKDLDRQIAEVYKIIQNLNLVLMCPVSTPYKYVGVSPLTAAVRRRFIAELRHTIRSEGENRELRRATERKLRRLRKTCVRWYDHAG